MELLKQGRNEYKISCTLDNGKVGTGRDPAEAYQNAKAEIIIVDKVNDVYSDLFFKKWNWEEIQKIAEMLEIETEQGAPSYCFLTIDQAEMIERIANETEANSTDLKKLILDTFKKSALEAREGAA